MARNLPDRSAGPKRVREYLTETLISNHDIPPDRAEKLALRWEHGRGSDMRHAKASLFEHLFGTSLGQYLLNSVHKDEHLEWRRSAAGVLYRCQYYTGSILMDLRLTPRFAILQTLHLAQWQS